jgi:hypothetical protein
MFQKTDDPVPRDTGEQGTGTEPNQPGTDIPGRPSTSGDHPSINQTSSFQPPNASSLALQGRLWWKGLG